MSEINVTVPNDRMNAIAEDVIKDVLYEIIRDKIVTTCDLDEMIANSLETVINDVAKSDGILEHVTEAVVREVDDRDIDEDVDGIVKAHVIKVVTASLE